VYYNINKIFKTKSFLAQVDVTMFADALSSQAMVQVLRRSIIASTVVEAHVEWCCIVWRRLPSVFAACPNNIPTVVTLPRLSF
jgi:hypothetical protein